ncbi:MAG: hypothetical protein US96_C0055G0013 [Candidatus Woesebacteria bacterium GW2011_GWB1_38_5b]|uniref:inorganic diphosphatase n=1 Tax=Candidatus Woesebacteria bacterium GW2011_GWB1_38_5b TaxID=1618569 RepID=A0A0G0MJ11_9BACT|nr:MAG: hypothetical protein US96_C0055G0013 [Candidatus Woesebacteria bacterium GW2011_GWB1_38_5b]
MITNAKDFLGQEVKVVIDRPLGSKHPKFKYFYQTNYGFVPNTTSPDGEELDVYFLGVDKPVKKSKGVCIAVIHRTNDEDDKLIVVPKGKNLSDKEIDKLTYFQEKYFEHIIVRG